MTLSELLKAGERYVARESWNGKKRLAIDFDDEYEFEIYSKCMFTDTFEWSPRYVWKLLVADILADDWEPVREPQ